MKFLILTIVKWHNIAQFSLFIEFKKWKRMSKHPVKFHTKIFIHVVSMIIII